jgi:hypothetical protein
MFTVGNVAYVNKYKIGKITPNPTTVEVSPKMFMFFLLVFFI